MGVCCNSERKKTRYNFTDGSGSSLSKTSLNNPSSGKYTSAFKIDNINSK